MHKNIPFAIYTVSPDDEQKLLETCRNKLKVTSASHWSYYTDILQCTVNKTYKKSTIFVYIHTLRCVRVLMKQHIAPSYVSKVGDLYSDGRFAGRRIRKFRYIHKYTHTNDMSVGPYVTTAF
jgi:hypothetical protein